MNSRAFTLAILISAFAMFMVYTYIDDKKNEYIKNYGILNSVVVAKVDINELELLDDSKVMVTTVPQSFLAPGHFKTIKEIENTIATVPIIKGEQITKPRVTFPGAKTGLARQVGDGNRAIAININESQAVAKLLRPGDRVDVLAAIDYSDGRKDMQTVQTILQDVLVLSTGLNMTNSIPMIGVETPRVIRTMNLNTYNSYNTITLELNPFDVQKLVFFLAYSGQRPYLALRNNNDKKVNRIGSTKIFSLLGEDDAAAKSYFEEKYRARPGTGGR